MIIEKSPFTPTLFESGPPLIVSDERKSYIKQLLKITSSDSNSADEAYRGLIYILTSGSVVLPVITALTPPNVTLGEPSFDIHVIGGNFTDKSVIVFNGFDEPTTFVNDSELTTGVNMDVWLAPAIVPIMVRNEENIVSNSIDFEFKEVAAQTATASKPAVTPKSAVVPTAVKK